MVQIARRRSWEHRAKFFGAIISAMPHKYVYDFGCGFCELKKYIGNKEYIGIDMVKYAPNVIQYDLTCAFPTTLVGDKENRLAVALGLFEYLAQPLKLIDKLLANFDCACFSYITSTEKRDNIVPAGQFLTSIMDLCAQHNKKCARTKIKDDPWEKLRGIYQDVFIITEGNNDNF